MNIKKIEYGIFKAQAIFRKQSKYRVANKSLRTWTGEIDGAKAVVVFDSRAEMTRWLELRLLERAGKISALHRQVRYQIIPKVGKEQPAFYTPDFTYIENGQTIAEEVKSKGTKMDRSYVLRRKLFKYRYPEIKFIEVVR